MKVWMWEKGSGVEVEVILDDDREATIGYPADDKSTKTTMVREEK